VARRHLHLHARQLALPAVIVRVITQPTAPNSGIPLPGGVSWNQSFSGKSRESLCGSIFCGQNLETKELTTTGISQYFLVVFAQNIHIKGTYIL